MKTVVVNNYVTLLASVVMAAVSLFPLTIHAADEPPEPPKLTDSLEVPRFNHGGAPPYSGLWGWEKAADAAEGKDGTIDLIAGEGGKGAAGTYPWWYLLLLQGSSNQQNMRVVGQYILNYLATLQLENNQKEIVAAPSTGYSGGGGAGSAAALVGTNVIKKLPPVVTLDTKDDLYELKQSVNNSFAVHIKKFCTAAEFKLGICLTDTQGKTSLITSEQTELAGDDLMASSLLNSDVLQDALDQEAALNYIQHVFPIKAIRKPLEMTKDDRYKSSSVANLQMQWSGVARQSLGENIFYRFFYDRVPIVGLKMPGAAADSKDISLKQLMRYEATWRYESDKWREAINSAPTNSLLREIANMEAFRMYMEYQQLQRMEELTAILAVMVINANSNYYADMAKSKISEAITTFGKPPDGFSPTGN